MRCAICGETACYVVSRLLPLCEDCRDDIGDEWEGAIAVEEIENDDEWED